MIRSKTKRLVVSGMMLAMGICLPLLIHSIGIISGNVLLPMHIPVFLCGFLAGPAAGAVTGFMLPFLNSLISGMPVMFPNAVIMSGELLTYGAISGLAFKLTGYKPKHLWIYVSLISAMIAGRCVYGLLAALIFFAFPGGKQLSVITAVVQGIPGIIIQLVLIPEIIWVCHKIARRE